MKAVNLIVSSFLGLAISTGVYAQNPGIDGEPLNLDTIVYIEEEGVIDLGFNSKAYLPEGFNPHELYVDLKKINFLKDEEIELNFQHILPEGFNAYAHPENFRNIDYIDPSDEEGLNFDTKEYLPSGFDPYYRDIDNNIVHL